MTNLNKRHICPFISYLRPCHRDRGCGGAHVRLRSRNTAKHAITCRGRRGLWTRKSGRRRPILILGLTEPQDTVFPDRNQIGVTSDQVSDCRTMPVVMAMRGWPPGQPASYAGRRRCASSRGVRRIVGADCTPGLGKDAATHARVRPVARPGRASRPTPSAPPRSAGQCAARDH